MDSTTPDATAVADAKSVIQDIVKTQKPIEVSPSSILATGNFAEIMRKAAKVNKQSLRDLSVKENFKFCRKHCKHFHKCECWKKPFEEQKSCYESKGYETVHNPNKEGNE